VNRRKDRKPASVNEHQADPEHNACGREYPHQPGAIPSEAVNNAGEHDGKGSPAQQEQKIEALAEQHEPVQNQQQPHNQRITDIPPEPAAYPGRRQKVHKQFTPP
jgi:hypothetical protein